MRLVFIYLFIITFSYAKKDFYYGFIDSQGNQISQKRILEVRDGFEIMNHARQLAKEGRIDEAYSQIDSFKKQNKIKILESDLIILYAELVLKKKSKRLILSVTKELEEAINDSKIHEADLAKAYMVLIELKLNTNKTNDAKYFANIIINNFDNKVTKAYGNIYLAKVYKYQKDYRKATSILYKVLTETTDVLVATLVADELFDVYILDGKKDKASELISKVLKKNIEYYANDSFFALEKVDRLVKVGMPEFAAQILVELLNRTTKAKSIEDFKFKLADTYMRMYDKTDKYLLEAKELYKDIINDYANGIYFEKSKMYIDEILMRERKIKPSVLASKYQNSESMQQKILLQELLNDRALKKYDVIFKSKKIYKKISNSIAQRFGYESVNVIFDEINIEMIKDHLNSGKCFLLKKAIESSRNETLELLIQDKEIKYKFFECLIEVPYEKAYLLVKETFSKSRNPNIYLYLERMALALQKYNEAEMYSSKVEMVDDKEVLSKEFLYKFMILNAKNDIIGLDKYFNYAYKNQQFIKENENNPVIIDFYYNYYLYLVKKELYVEAQAILKKLFEKQKESNAYVYSPFVELELAKHEQANNNNKGSLELLLTALKNARKISPNDLAQTYYEISRLYEEFGNKLKKDEFINKCKEVENTKNSFYKKMCDEM